MTSKFNCNSLLITCVAIFLIALLKMFPAVAQVAGNKQSGWRDSGGSKLGCKPHGRTVAYVH